MAKKGGGGETQKVKVQYPGFWKNMAVPTLEDMGGTAQEQMAQPLHPFESEGLDRIAGMARRGGELLNPASGAVGNIFHSGGMAAPARGFAENLVAGNFVNPAMDETRRIAMGGDMGTNPWLEATYERASRPLIQQLQQDVNPGIDIGAASSGRLGSGMHALLRNRAGEQTGQALTDLATGIYSGAYESDQGRRMGALGQLAGLGQQDVGNRMAGAGMFDTGTARTLQAAGMAPGLDEARYSDPSRLLGVGQAYQDAEWEPSERYLRSLYAMPGVSGGSSTTGPGGPGPLAQGISGGLGAMAMGSMMGLGGMPLAGVAGLGALGGLLSDERAKEDIEPIGITFGGTPVYRYRYREEFGGGPAQIGVMAQDVIERQPDAVARGPDGLLRVLYERVV